MPSEQFKPQYVATKVVQTHNSVNIANGAWSTSSTWIDTYGFRDLAVTALSETSHNIRVNVQWSNDGVNWQGEDNDVVNATRQRVAGQTPIKARYCKVALYNGDTVAHNMSAWIYLKV
jgi:hypothetical protein